MSAAEPLRWLLSRLELDCPVPWAPVRPVDAATSAARPPDDDCDIERVAVPSNN